MRLGLVFGFEPQVARVARRARYAGAARHEDEGRLGYGAHLTRTDRGHAQAVHDHVEGLATLGLIRD